MERLEPGLRERAGKLIARGNVTANLSLKRPAREAVLSINHHMLDQLLKITNDVAEKAEAAPPRVDGLLAIRGVLETTEPEESEEERDGLHQALGASFTEALEVLVINRRDEGGRLAAIIDTNLDEVAELTRQASALATAQPAAIAERLKTQLQSLSDQDPRLSEERLAQEVALLIVKGDIREELDRLGSHVEAARELVATTGPVGRKLDFLCQEFNREANTLCSKSSNLELTRAGLDLKAVIDRIREQVQNIE
jgi:uncharacterized protein (TIGR00255 family)